MKTGLRQRIEHAKTSTEVHALLEEGNTYEFASRGTRNSWKHTAERTSRTNREAAKTKAAEEKKD
jgi:hypothetical protein